ncbi:hypothetical protein [Hyphomonas sp.]|uniref:hypothetical protein n=1 Tax=Hyphomonas sp. TaxID=87 RepID=UPI003918C194
MSPEAGSAAAQLWRQYGEDAVVIAVLRAAEVAAMGDLEALNHWDEVREILTAMAAPEGPSN